MISTLRKNDKNNSSLKNTQGSGKIVILKAKNTFLNP